MKLSINQLKVLKQAKSCEFNSIYADFSGLGNVLSSMENKGLIVSRNSDWMRSKVTRHWMLTKKGEDLKSSLSVRQVDGKGSK